MSTLRVRVILVFLLVVCLGLPTTAQDGRKATQSQAPSRPINRVDQESSCRTFVQGFYDWYITPTKPDRYHRGEELSSDDVLQLKPHVLSRRLLKLLLEDKSVQDKNPGYITGLDFDPFTNSQDSSPKSQIQKVSIDEGTCKAVVWGIRDGLHEETVVPELRRGVNAWVFVNFHYPGDRGGSENLIDELAMLKVGRKYLQKIKALPRAVRMRASAESIQKHRAVERIPLYGLEAGVANDSA